MSDSTNPKRVTCGEIACKMQELLRPRIAVLIAAVAVGLAVLWANTASGTDTLLSSVLIVAGGLAPTLAWLRAPAPSLPLILLFAVQTVLIYALPVLIENKTLAAYPESELTTASLEVLIFGLTLAVGWQIGFKKPQIAQPLKNYYRIKLIASENPKALERSALLIVGLGLIYLIAVYIGVLDPLFENLPAGTRPLITNVALGLHSAGFLIGGYALGTGAIKSTNASLIWLAYVVHFILNSSGLLLSSNATNFIAITLGHSLGARRPPWIPIALTIAAASFLNLGKFEMRELYWGEDASRPRPTLMDLPSLYTEWSGYSLDAIIHNRTREESEAAVGQNMADRINNMQNLLFVQDAIVNRDLPPLHGATYAIIPPLLVPRILWPSKPRTHEGQVMLNVQFGRQALESTFTTYIAWGLLAEAYGNFGPFLGAVLCGFVLGWIIGRLERFIEPYPATSLECFIFLIISLSFILSFEMVASVWITSLFQGLCAVIITALPFVEKKKYTTLEPRA